MPIDLANSIKSTSQFVFASDTLNNILGSSIILGLLISIVLIVLVMILYPAKKNTSISVIGKIFIYSFIITSILVFLHDGIIKSQYDNNKYDGFLDEKHMLLSNNNIPIKPNLQTVRTVNQVNEDVYPMINKPNMFS